jgi:RNA polymerase sigma-70 factor (ECF subfamily)
MIDSTERVVIDEVLAGNVEQYRYLVERYHRGLLQHLFNLMNDEAAAEDIAQEAFIQAYQKLAQYNQAYAFSTWLYKIADNKAYRQLRQLKPTSDIDQMAEVIPSDGPSLDDQTDHLLAAGSVRQAIDKLPLDYKQVVILYYWDGCSYEQIAEITERPIGTVRSWLFRAKEQLRKELYGQV